MPNELDRYKSLSAEQKTPLIDLEKHPADASLLHYPDIEWYRREMCVPWRWHNERLYIACTKIDESTRAQVKAKYEDDCELVYCTARDHRHALETAFGNRIEHDARTRILRETPQFSAFYTTNYSQKLTIILIFSLLAMLSILWPQATIISGLCLVNAMYLITICFKYVLYRHSKTDSIKPPSTDSLDESTLPIYSILIPMYHEEESVSRLLNSIRALDYPKDKLDVKLVIEADDNKTYSAIALNSPESYFDIIRVPPSQPRTKPKACSYALTYARGEFVTIYDAEDRPEPSQLKKAIATFRASPNNVICLQGRLNYYNWNENILTRCFAIEYANLFDLMLPGLQSLGIPLPLGGTSNHIHLERLRELKDWDPYNVTEDADLGVRLAMHGYATRMLDSVTMEEAPIKFLAWIKQRTRWIKGYMQTWLVYMRHPKALHQQLGAKGFWGFHLFIGSPCFVFLLSPILWGFSALWAMGVIHNQIYNWLIALSIFCFCVGYISQMLMARQSVNDWNWPNMKGLTLIYPFYWFLHSLASLRALWQLIVSPHYWDKTSHGKTKINQSSTGVDSYHSRSYKPIFI